MDRECAVHPCDAPFRGPPAFGSHSFRSHHDDHSTRQQRPASGRTRLGAIAIAASFLGLGIAVGATTPDAAPDDPPATKSPEQTMLGNQMIYLTPGAPHEALQRRVGTWTTELAYWPAPGAEAMRTTGTSTIKSLWDGRYLEEHFSCNWQGMPFEGRGITGFDNFKAKYVTIWIDSMATGIMHSEGDGGADAKRITYRGQMPDFLNAAYKASRSEEIEESPDRRRMAMYDTTPDGTEYKAMEIVYTRAAKQ